MKKKNILVVISILFVVIIVGMVIILFNVREKDDTYVDIKIGDYQFIINDKYQYEYLEDEGYGVLKNDMFLSSYIYISGENYSSLISSSSYYTNMGSDELDSNIEELTFGEYDGFINVKKVNYADIDRDYNLVIIFIKVSSDNTLVFQYEISSEENTEKILKDIKMGLLEINKYR